MTAAWQGAKTVETLWDEQRCWLEEKRQLTGESVGLEQCPAVRSAAVRNDVGFCEKAIIARIGSAVAVVAPSQDTRQLRSSVC